MNLSKIVVPTLIAVAAVVSPSVASASPKEDLAFTVQENGDYSRGQIVAKLMTFELPEKCWTKVLDSKKNRAVHVILGAATDISHYAREVTGDDWMKIASQGANNREANRALVDKKIDAFKSRFSIKVKLDGDDCDASGNALWLKYLGHTTEALTRFPPKSGKAFVTVDVKEKASGAKVDVTNDGTKFVVIAGRDVEESGWPNDIDLPFKRVSTKN